MNCLRNHSVVGRTAGGLASGLVIAITTDPATEANAHGTQTIELGQVIEPVINPLVLNQLMDEKNSPRKVGTTRDNTTDRGAAYHQTIPDRTRLSGTILSMFTMIWPRLEIHVTETKGTASTHPCQWRHHPQMVRSKALPTTHTPIHQHLFAKTREGQIHTTVPPYRRLHCTQDRKCRASFQSQPEPRIWKEAAGVVAPITHLVVIEFEVAAVVAVEAARKTLTEIKAKIGDGAEAEKKAEPGAKVGPGAKAELAARVVLGAGAGRPGVS